MRSRNREMSPKADIIRQAEKSIREFFMKIDAEKYGEKVKLRFKRYNVKKEIKQ